MIDFFADMFSFRFMVYALIAGILLSVSAAVLGVTLVLKRYSMIGDGLSHVAFGSLAVASALNFAPMKVAVPVVMLSAFLLLRLSESGKLKGDSMTAVLSVSSLSVGYIAVHFAGTNINIENYLFGSLLAVGKSGVIWSIALFSAVAVLYLLFYHRIFSVTFDGSFSRAIGLPVGFYDTLIALLTACVVVIGMKLMGTLLISGLIVFPPIIAMRIFKSFRGVMICAAILPVIAVFSGLVLAFLLDIPLGAAVIFMNLVLLLIFSIIGMLGSRSSH